MEEWGGPFMRWSHVAIVVASLEQAEEGLRLGATDVVFAVNLFPRSSNLASEPIPNAQVAPLTEWGRRVRALGGRPHIQLRNQALSTPLISECKALVRMLVDAGFVECWTGDLGLLLELSNHCTGITTRADWRLPLTNADACRVALATGAQGLCLAPPFPQCPADANTAYLLIQGIQSLDPRMDYQPELFTAPLLLNDLECQLFTYGTMPRDFASADNRRLRRLEGLWHSTICPFAHLEAQKIEWRGWGCAVCEVVNVVDGWVVLELPGSPEALTAAMRVLRIAAGATSPDVLRSTIAEDEGLRPYLCERGARCRRSSDVFRKG